jgi:hypothetical protein
MQIADTSQDTAADVYETEDTPIISGRQVRRYPFSLILF